MDVGPARAKLNGASEVADDYIGFTGRVKLKDAVTYDDNGQRIALGDRNNFNVDDSRYASETPRPEFVQRPQSQTTVTVSAPERFNIKTGKGSSVIDTHLARAEAKGANVKNYERYDLDNPQELQ